MSAASKRYLLTYHASMLRDQPRVDRYREAIERSVKAGDVVVDLGAGTGVLSFIACQAGAERVYAIEAGEVVNLARELAADNGFADRIVFVHDQSYRAELPEQADVLITETLWNFGLGEGMLGFIADARERFLKPDARIIPLSVELELAAVEEPDLHERLSDTSPDRDGLSFASMRRYRSAGVFTPRVEEGQLLTDPSHVVGIDVVAATTQDLTAEVELTVIRAGRLDGLCGWFEAELAEGVRLTNRPGAPDSARSWSHAFFPLSAAVEVEPGDRIGGSLRSTGNGAHWHWRTRIERDGELVAADDQSTFFGFPVDRGGLAARAGEAAPRLTREGQVLSFVLGRLDGSRTVDALVEEVAAAFPDYFRRPGDADRLVRETAERHGEL